MKVTILGCGPSGGVPLIGCTCAVCQSVNTKNQRTRSSILIETNGKRLLVDSSPDLRQQALRAGIKTVDGVLYTHNHADHTHGIDELRSFNYHSKQPVPIYGTAEVIDQLKHSFSYALAAPANLERWYKPALETHVIDEYGEFSVSGVRINSFLQYHGKGKSTGYRIGKMAYSTDVDNLPDESLQLLESLDLWVVDCLQIEPAPTHAHLAKTLGWIERLKPRRAILTHMSHVLEYEVLRRQLPPHVEPAFDGMVIELD